MCTQGGGQWQLKYSVPSTHEGELDWAPDSCIDTVYSHFGEWAREWKIFSLFLSVSRLFKKTKIRKMNKYTQF